MVKPPHAEKTRDPSHCILSFGMGPHLSGKLGPVVQQLAQKLRKQPLSGFTSWLKLHSGWQDSPQGLQGSRLKLGAGF